MLGGPYKRVKEPLGGMIRGALATGGTGGATQPRQEYAAAGQGECKPIHTPSPPDRPPYCSLRTGGREGGSCGLTLITQSLSR